MKQFCCIPGIEGEIAASLLGSLDEEDVQSVFESPHFPVVKLLNNLHSILWS